MTAGLQPVLVVDDHRTMRRIIPHHLAGLGLGDVDTAADPLTALAMLRRRRYRLVLSDWRMAPLDGLELLRILRHDPAYADYATVPFLLITAESRADQVQAACRLGVDGYLIKPFDRAALACRLGQVATAVQGPI